MTPLRSSAPLLLAAALGCANTTTTPDAASGAAPAEAGAAAAVPSGTASAAAAAAPKATDTFATSMGELKVTPIHHGTVLLQIAGKTIVVDPWSEGNLDGIKADLVLITDIHQDHYDPPGLEKVKKAGTVVVAPGVVAEKVPGAVVLKNGESKTIDGVGIAAIAMYNLKRGPSEGKLFHDKGRGNGYVLTFGDKHVYFSGDTECIDEMRALKEIDVAFVCMNLPYTMPPAEAAECIKAFKPKVVIPYHYKGANLDELKTALKDEKAVEVRTRAFY